jgi:hypothetical protein
VTEKTKGITEGSASVDVSPIESSSREAIFRNIRRIIFPERVYNKYVDIEIQVTKHCGIDKP